MDATRQNKIDRLIQKVLGEIFQLKSRSLFDGAMITVTRVNVTKDLSLARVYLSLFATKDQQALIVKIKASSKEIKRELAAKVKNQLRLMPELEYFLDDSLDYIENIDKLLKQ
ncbi:MAG: ribosome-binding factor A [Bacteroidetes bacterium CG2_30_32_10]|nr:MAG: ribosome-binding factor A [Bacteroidetes bacterium CG2_30_32_10]